jgi:hypothetical protein
LHPFVSQLACEVSIAEEHKNLKHFTRAQIKNPQMRCVVLYFTHFIDLDGRLLRVHIYEQPSVF